MWCWVRTNLHLADPELESNRFDFGASADELREEIRVDLNVQEYRQQQTRLCSIVLCKETRPILVDGELHVHSCSSLTCIGLKGKKQSM